MKHVLVSAVASVLAISVAGTAVAQTFYARERIKAVPNNGQNPVTPTQPGSSDGSANPTPTPTPAPTPPAEQYSWSPGEWGQWSSTCSDVSTRTRPITCQNQSGTVATDDECTGSRPESTQTAAIYNGCQNMLYNGDFTRGIENWNGSAFQHNLARALIQTGGSMGTTTRALEAGRSYELSFGCENFRGSGNFCEIRINVSAGGQTLLTRTYRATGHQALKRVVGTITAPNDAAATVSLTNTSTDTSNYGWMHVDDIVLKPL